MPIFVVQAWIRQCWPLCFVVFAADFSAGEVGGNGTLLFALRTFEMRPRVCAATRKVRGRCRARSEEHTSELQSLMRISYAVFCLTKHIFIHTFMHLSLFFLPT